MAYVQKNNPFPVTSCGRRRTFTQGGEPGNDRAKESPYKEADPPKTIGPGKNFNKVAKAVTGDVKPGSKDAGRRKSFCARSKSWNGERGIAARKRWNC